jgi:hypothetical protein
MPLLGGIEHAPGSRQENEPPGNQRVAEEVQGVQMRIAPPAEQRFPEVARVMREDVEAGVPPLEPTRQEIEREREAVHLREEGDQKGRERPE